MAMGKAEFLGMTTSQNSKQVKPYDPSYLQKLQNGIA